MKLYSWSKWGFPSLSLLIFELNRINLYIAPGSRKVAGSHFLVDVHLQAENNIDGNFSCCLLFQPVLVTSCEKAIYPCEGDISMVTLKDMQVRSIPHIFHFFYTSAIWGQEISHLKVIKNSGQKLSRNKTVCKILHCVLFFCVPVGKFYI